MGQLSQTIRQLTHAINHALYSKVSFHPIRDFTPVVYVGESPNVLVSTNRLAATTVKELIALVKSKPGQFNYGSSGGAGTETMRIDAAPTIRGRDRPRDPAALKSKGSSCRLPKSKRPA